MREWRENEIQEERTRLEQGAAMLLGYMLFEYSRLDMDLGLFLVWANDGQNLDALTNRLNAENFSSKLEFLDKSVKTKFANRVDVLEAYAAWINEAHKIRSVRNQLFHGRWGFSPVNESVSCAVGLPTSPAQRVTPYSLADLQTQLDSMRAVRIHLQRLRDLWPV